MQKILVIRNDKIGDFMLAWPSFAMLKQSLPDAEITALVPNYTKPLAELCPWIDHIIVDCGKKADKTQKKALIETIRQKQFDASINLFSDSYNALAVWKAGIPNRVAPATKLAQIFYNHRVKQKRSQSAKPEYEYNLDLVRAFLDKKGIEIQEPKAPYLSFPSDVIEVQQAKLCNALSLNSDNPIAMVHVGSGGSANNLSMSQYAEFIAGISSEYQWVLTAGPGEEDSALQLFEQLTEKGIQAKVYIENDGLEDFTCSIACASLFVAGSTGPLHIAAAVDVPTVGFFPSKRSATPLRWQPINSIGHHIAFCPPKRGDKAEQEDMSNVDILDAITQTNQWLATS